MDRMKMVVAVHLLLIEENKILLLRRYNTGYEDGKYSVCADHVDGNEIYIDAMIRETKEEIGIEINRDQLETVQMMHRITEYESMDYFLFASEWDGRINNMEPNKCDELKWFDINRLPENTIPYIKYAIEQYQNDNKFTYFGWPKNSNYSFA